MKNEKGEELIRVLTLWDRSWLSLCYRIKMKESKIFEIYKDLMSRYAEKHRKYHTQEHIEHCISEFEKTKYLAENPDTVEMAIYFHDAVYDPQSQNNEDKSTFLSWSQLKEACEPRFVNQVGNLVSATTHIFDPEDPDTKLLLDIDLSIFGQSKEAFEEYEKQIREEYKHVTDPVIYRRERIKVLSRFLARWNFYNRNIFYTDYFVQKYEEQARKNLSRSIINLALT